MKATTNPQRPFYDPFHKKETAHEDKRALEMIICINIMKHSDVP